MIKAQVFSKYNNARISPKKVALILDKVRGEQLENAKIFLSFDPTKAAEMILKTLKAAEANAVNNYNLKKDNLYLSEAYVDGGRMIKTWRAGSKGRFSQILKRNSNIIVGLSERKGA